MVAGGWQPTSTSRSSIGNARVWHRDPHRRPQGMGMAQEHGSAGAGWFEAGWQGGTRGLNAEQEPPLKPATKKPRRRQGREGKQGCNQAWGGVLRGAAMRLRRRRLKPKAAAAPSRGMGPGTAAVEGGPRNT